nr:hypothetical protein [Morchella crassipes]
MGRPEYPPHHRWGGRGGGNPRAVRGGRGPYPPPPICPRLPPWLVIGYWFPVIKNQEFLGFLFNRPAPSTYAPSPPFISQPPPPLATLAYLFVDILPPFPWFYLGKGGGFVVLFNIRGASLHQCMS